MIQWFLVYLQRQPSLQSNSRTFLWLQKETPHPLATTANSLPALATINLLSVSMDLPILDISYKRDHTRCGLLCLPSFTQHNVFKVHPHCGVCWHFTPFYGWVIFQCIDVHFVYPITSWWVFGLCMLHLLRIELLWTFTCTSLCQCMFSVFWGDSQEWNCWVVW